MFCPATRPERRYENVPSASASTVAGSSSVSPAPSAARSAPKEERTAAPARAQNVTESARAHSYIVKLGLFKEVITETLSILAVNALAVNVLAVNNVFQGVSHSDFVHF